MNSNDDQKKFDTKVPASSEDHNSNQDSESDFDSEEFQDADGNRADEIEEDDGEDRGNESEESYYDGQNRGRSFEGQDSKPKPKPSAPIKFSLPPPNNVVLIGGMGSGKSSVGWILAKLLGFGFVDTDKLVERRTGKNIAALFSELGETGFRSAERDILQNWRSARSYVFSVGGGAVMDDGSWQIIQELGITVWLNPPVQEVARRLLRSPIELNERPLLSDLTPKESPDLLPEERQKKLVERLIVLNGMRQGRYRQAKIVFESGYESPEISAKIINETLVKMPSFSASNLRETRFNVQQGSSAVNRWGNV